MSIAASATYVPVSHGGCRHFHAIRAFADADPDDRERFEALQDDIMLIEFVSYVESVGIVPVNVWKKENPLHVSSWRGPFCSWIV